MLNKNNRHSLIKAVLTALAVLCMGVTTWAASPEVVIDPAPAWVYIAPDGTLSYYLDVPEDYRVERTMINLYKEVRGVWPDRPTKTLATQEETGYCIPFTSVGRYCCTVRVKYYGGAYSETSGFSNVINISEDDIYVDPNSKGGQTGPSGQWTPSGPASDVPGSYVPAGPSSDHQGPSVNNNPANTPSGTVPGTNPYAPENPWNAGWVQDGYGWKYMYANGTYARSCFECIDGKWYFFNDSSYMHTGWLWYQNCWYLMLPTGERATGFRNVNEKWYYLNESGIMLYGPQIINGRSYFFDSTGAMLRDSYTPDGHYYDVSGVMVY